MFLDRTTAGRGLAEELRGRLPADAVVLGVPRGGVVVAAEVARILGLALDIVVTSKLGAPGNPEYAVGAVDADGIVLGSSVTHVAEEYLRRETSAKSAEVKRRLSAYRGSRPLPTLAGRTTVVVDDGIATGLTVRAAVEYLRRSGASRIVVATPVMPADVARGMRADGFEVIAVEEPSTFWAVGQFYSDFAQTTDAEVKALLAEAWERESGRSRP